MCECGGVGLFIFSKLNTAWSEWLEEIDSLLTVPAESGIIPKPKYYCLADFNVLLLLFFILLYVSTLTIYSNLQNVAPSREMINRYQGVCFTDTYQVKTEPKLWQLMICVCQLFDAKLYFTAPSFSPFNWFIYYFLVLRYAKHSNSRIV